MTSQTSILVIGAGQAAAVAVAALRDEGFEGRITVVGDEAHAPYERPPLSKAVLAAVQADEPSIHVKDADFFTARDIDLRLGTCVESLDAANKTARLSDGDTIQFSQCLLATGGAARVLPVFPVSAPQVHYLRTLDDARKLRTALASTDRAIVVGGGFLGLEIASTAREMGVAVSLIESLPRVLARVMPEQFSQWLQNRVQDKAQVNLHIGQTITAVTLPEDGSPATVELSDGTALSAPVVAVSVGLTPATRLAEVAGIRIDESNGGILVDERCQTSHPDIYAAGDCTSQRHPGHAGTLRMESWQNANEQARTAALAMLNRDVGAPAYPWFWTDQFGCNIQMLGLPDSTLHYVVRGALDATAEMPKFIMVGLRDQTAVHVIAVNAGGDLRALRPIVEKALPIDPAQFIDESVTVRAFAKSVLASAASQA